MTKATDANTASEAVSHARIMMNRNGQLKDSRHILDGSANLAAGLKTLQNMQAFAPGLNFMVTGAIFYADGQRAHMLRKDAKGKIVLADQGECTAEAANLHLDGFVTAHSQPAASKTL